MEQGAEVRSIERDGWHISIRMAPLNAEGLLWGSVDVACQGEHMCRLAIAHGFATEDELIAEFEVKASNWIEDWLARPATESGNLLRSRGRGRAGGVGHGPGQHREGSRCGTDGAL